MATFQVSNFLIFDPFLKSLFWMKQIQGSVRVKLINTLMHSPSFFSFHFFSFSISFPKWSIFTILRLYMAWKMWKITTLTWEKSSWRLVEKSAFPMYYSVYNWIGEHEITKLKKKFASNPEKRTQKQEQKDMNEMEWHKVDYLIFSTMHMRKRHLFCTRSHHNVPYEKQQMINKGSKLSVLVRARAQLLNMLYISTHLSLPHGENT